MDFNDNMFSRPMTPTEMIVFVTIGCVVGNIVTSLLKRGLRDKKA